MDKDLLLATLRKYKSEIEGFGVAKIGLGSYLTGIENRHSDIDIYISFHEAHATYDNFIHLCDFLENLFPGHKVEVVTEGWVSPYIEPAIVETTEYA